MTFEVKKSQITGVDYDALVLAHTAELTKYADHMAAVARGEADAYPPPYADPLIDNAIRRPDLVPDYVIVDDGPSPEQLFEQRRKNLHIAVNDLETAAKRRVVTDARRKLLSLQANQIMRKPVEKRAPDEVSFLDNLQAIQDRIDNIVMHGAALQVEVEGLSSDTIDAWTPSAFPE